jgi:hypothetical protein
MSFVTFPGLIFVSSEEVEHEHHLEVLEYRDASKVVILSDNENENRAANANHNQEEVPTHRIINEH